MVGAETLEAEKLREELMVGGVIGWAQEQVTQA